MNTMKLVKALVILAIFGGLAGLTYTKAVKPRQAQRRIEQMRAVVYQAHEDADAALNAAGLPKTWPAEITCTPEPEGPINLSWDVKDVVGPVEREPKVYQAIFRKLGNLDTKYAVLSGEGPACARWAAAMVATHGREKEVETFLAKETPTQQQAAAQAHAAFEKALQGVARVQGARFDPGVCGTPKPLIK